jgi:hypothetical protein
LSFFQVIYGLRIAANIPLPGIPVESDSGSFDVRIRLKEESSSPSPFDTLPNDFFYTSASDETDEVPTLRVGLLAGGEYFGLFYQDGSRFAVQRKGREIWADWPQSYTIEDACTYLVGPVMGFLLRLRGVICLHASGVEIEGQAVALVGSAGAGKSTTAAAFANLHYTVISDDVVPLEDRTGHFLVLPGYPRVNLWPDSARSLYGSEDSLPLIAPSWDKRFVPLDSHGRQFSPNPLPLGAIYVLGRRDAELTTPVIEEFTAREALMTLVGNTYVNYLLDGEMRRREFDLLSRVVASVPVRRVFPTANPSDVFGLCEAIVRDARQLGMAAPVIPNRGHDLRARP